MAFAVFITSSARKASKRLPKKILRELMEYCANEIEIHPFDHPKLHPPLSECRSFHCKINNVQYRIAYRIAEEKNRIDIVLIGPRENFYDRLRQALQK